MIHWNENQEKTTSIGLQFRRPKLSGESCFTHFLNYGGLCKERSTKQTKDTFQHRALPKKIRETLKISIFSFTITNFVNRGRRGKGLYFNFLKIGRKCSDFGKKVSWFWSSIGRISHLKCSFKVFLGGTIQHFFLNCVFDDYRSALIPRKLLCPDKFQVTRLYYNDLSADCSTKESIILC